MHILYLENDQYGVHRSFQCSGVTRNEWRLIDHLQQRDNHILAQVARGHLPRKALRAARHRAANEIANPPKVNKLLI